MPFGMKTVYSARRVRLDRIRKHVIVRQPSRTYPHTHPYACISYVGVIWGWFRLNLPQYEMSFMKQTLVQARRMEGLRQGGRDNTRHLFIPHGVLVSLNGLSLYEHQCASLSVAARAYAYTHIQTHTQTHTHILGSEGTKLPGFVVPVFLLIIFFLNDRVCAVHVHTHMAQAESYCSSLYLSSPPALHDTLCSLPPRITLT
jgi:hypothetical protein